MDRSKGIPFTLLGGAIMVLGVIWGATSQKETFIGNALTDDPAVGGDVTFLTAFVVGIGAALMTASLGRAPLSPRVLGVVTAGTATWLLVFLFQGAWPNYIVLPDFGQATILQSNLLLESQGATSVLLPLLAIGILLLSALGWAVHKAGIIGFHERTITDIRLDHLVVVALALPVLVLTAAGMLRVMFEIPADDPGQGLVTFIHPLAAAACLLLCGTIVARVIQFTRLRRDPDLAWPVMESWRTMDRIDMAGIAFLALVSVLSSFLPGDEPANITSAGPTLLFTLRSHGQSVIFLSAVLVPLYLLQRHIGDQLPLLRDQPEDPGRSVQKDAWGMLGTVGAASVIGAVVALAVDRSLLAWAVALVPSAIAAGVIGRPVPSALVRLMAAWTLWGLGNTIQASYQANTFPDLEFAVHPGLLALWRMASVSMTAWVVYDLLCHLGRRERSWIRVPLGLGAAVGTALMVLLMLPLNVWAESAIPVNKVAVGSLLRSQLSGVQVVMSIMAVACGLGATSATARLVRPDWFHRGGKDVPDTQATGTPG